MPNPLATCHARLDDDLLVIGNDLFQRTWRWNGGSLIHQSLRCAFGDDWEHGLEQPDLVFPGLDAGEPQEGSLSVREVPDDRVSFAHLEAVVTVRYGELWVRRVFSVFPGVAALRCELFLKGRADGVWSQPLTAQADLVNLENAETPPPEPFSPVLDTLALNRAHVHCEAVEFFDVTDRTNTLVQRVGHLPFTFPAHLRGNLLLVRDVVRDRSLFLLKEAPCSNVQLHYPGYDFETRVDALKLVGPGMCPQDLRGDEWTRAYGWVLGVAEGREEALLLTLRGVQHRLRRQETDRDEMIMVNTWGDRSQDSRICESFVLREIEAAARLGATVLQLDDGWQKGRTSNSAQAGGSVEEIWARSDYWDVHPERFPRGLGPVLDAAAAAGLRLALWYAPSRSRAFADWEKDAAQILQLWREHGVHTFKIDMVKLPSKAADRNLRAMFDRVLSESGGAVSFNLDATANRRFGYHDATAYGNIFLENRYTDWRNYYPTWTLRNLWMLSRFVPPQRLQIECLNIWRNPGNYDANDPLAPARVGFPFAVAVTLPAQPLFWFECSHLPEEAFAMADEIRRYRALQQEWHANPILPLGEEPDGRSWTGFQSIGPRSGFVLLLREHTDRAVFGLRLWDVDDGDLLALEPLLGEGPAFEAQVDSEGRVRVHLPRPWTYALYRYHRLTPG